MQHPTLQFYKTYKNKNKMKKPTWYLYHFQTKSGKVVHTEISVKLKQWQKDNIINSLKAKHNEETIICKLIGIQS